MWHKPNSSVDESVLQSLMSLLNVGPTIDPALVVCAAHTLSDLCKCLQVRIQYFQDPTLYVPKQGECHDIVYTMHRLEPGVHSQTA